MSTLRLPAQECVKKRNSKAYRRAGQSPKSDCHLHGIRKHENGNYEPCIEFRNGSCIRNQLTGEETDCLSFSFFLLCRRRLTKPQELLVLSSLFMFNERARDHRHLMQIANRHSPLPSAFDSLPNAVCTKPLALSGMTPERALSYIQRGPTGMNPQLSDKQRQPASAVTFLQNIMVYLSSICYSILESGCPWKTKHSSFKGRYQIASPILPLFILTI